jgi:hypothetical protein
MNFKYDSLINTNFHHLVFTVPSKPQNVKVLNVTSTTIKIGWNEPERPNGVIHAYRVYYMFLNQTLLHLPILKNGASTGMSFNYTLVNLSEYNLVQNILCLFWSCAIEIQNILQDLLRNTGLSS